MCGTEFDRTSRFNSTGSDLFSNFCSNECETDSFVAYLEEQNQAIADVEAMEDDITNIRFDCWLIYKELTGPSGWNKFDPQLLQRLAERWLNWSIRLGHIGQRNVGQHNVRQHEVGGVGFVARPHSLRSNVNDPGQPIPKLRQPS
jgi:hypothetical protein